MVFGLLKDVLIIFSGVFLVFIGGVFVLVIWGMLMLILVGIGFIVLFGVVVFNGLVMLVFICNLWYEKKDFVGVIIEGVVIWLCFVLMIVLVVSLGFVFMVLNMGIGVEV